MAWNPVHGFSQIRTNTGLDGSLKKFNFLYPIIEQNKETNFFIMTTVASRESHTQRRISSEKLFAICRARTF